MSLKNLFVAFFAMIIAFLFILGIFSFLMFQNQKEVSKSLGNRLTSYEIANELKQSSEDLTRYCRTFIETGDSKWEKKFHEVLDIRNGKAPRPNGRYISFQDSIRKFDFTETEFEKLRIAEKYSNDLTRTELIAINAAKGLYEDKNGDFTVKRKPDLEFARNIVFNEKCHADINKVLSSIDDFIVLENQRNVNKIESYDKINHNLLYSIIGAIIIVSLMAIILFFLLKEKIIFQINELKLAYTKIGESETRFRMFMDHMPGLAFIKDNNRRVLFTNKGFNTYLKINPASIVQKSAVEIFPPDFADKIDTDDQRVLQTGNKEIIEEHFADRDWMTYKFTLPDSTSKPFLGGFSVDITARKKAEENFRKLSVAVEQSPASIIITDTSGNIEYVNKKFTELTGYSFNEVIGKRPNILKSGRMENEGYEQLWKIISSGQTWKGEFCNRKKNGEIYWESASISPLYNDSGKISHFIAVKEDITGQKYFKELLIQHTQNQNRLISLLQSNVESPGKFLKMALNEIIDLTGSRLGFIYNYEELNQEFHLNLSSVENINWETENSFLEIFCLDKSVILDELIIKRKEIIVNNYPCIEPSLKTKNEETIELKNLLAIPIFHKSRIVAVVCVTNKQTDYDQSDITQLQLFLGSIWERYVSLNSEAYLRESENKFRTVFERSKDAMLIHDGIRILDCNEAVIKMFGADSKVQLLQNSLLQLSQEFQQDGLTSVEKSESIINEAFRQKAMEFEWLMKRLNGEEFPVEVIVTLLEIDHREVFFTVLRDITARKKAEEVSRKLTLAVDQNPASIVITNTDGIIEYVNPKFSEITGYSFDEAIGQKPSILKSGERTTDEYKQLWESISAGREWRGEFCNKKKNGEYYWEAASISPIFNNQRKITHYVAIKEDITEKKQTEQALQYERKLLRTLIDNIPDLIYSKDIYARKTLANLADIRLMGLTAEAEAIGKDDYAFYPTERAKEFIEEDMKVIESGEPALNTEGWHINDQGQSRYYVTSKYPLRDEKEQIIGLVGIGRDITERKLKELEVEKQLNIQTNLVKLLRKEADSSIQFLDEVLEVALNITDSKLGYIYLYNETTKEFTLNTWSREVMNECSVLEPRTIYQLEKTGIWGEAVRQRKEIIINDFKADNPLKKGYPEGHVHLLKFLTIPVFQKEQIIAVVGVANKETNYDQVDVNNLHLLMSSIWAKVDNLKTEVYLKERETQLRTLGDNLPNGFTYQYLYNSNGNSRFTYVSAGIYRTNGLLPEDVINDINLFYNQVPEHYKKLIFEAEEKSVKDLSVFNVEIQFRITNGQMRWLKLNSTPRLNDDGSIIFDGWIIDITEQKHAEEALIKSESNLRDAQAIAHVGSWEVDLENNTITGSEEAARIYGLEPLGRKLPLQLIQQAVVGQYRERLDEILKGLIINKSVYDEIYQIRRINDAELRWIHSIAERIDDDSGTPVKIAGSIQDITDWKNTEIALRESESKFQSFFMNSLVATAITSLETHKFIEVNDTFCKQTGFTREEVIGKTAEEINIYYDKEDQIIISEEIKKYGYVSGTEVKFYNKAGEVRSCIFSGSILKFSGAFYLLSTVVDFTDRKLMEEALKESETTLRELNATKDKFFSIIAHDLRSPFHALLGFSQILTTDYHSLSENDRISFIRNISDLVRNTYKLVENLLEWSRIQTGKMEFKPELFNLVLEFYQSLGLLKQLALNKNLEFSYSIDQSYKIFADKNMLLTIIRNIVSNSIKFTKPGGKITLDVQSDEDHFIFSVTDNGVGIKQENLSRLFSLDNNLSTKGTNNEIGTGLGLILCKEMIEKHNGKIWVESTEGKGTTFYFTIPFSPES
ncbi:MAG: PAS domain S-box protein [Ignavibacteriales bacterium]|nr:MAG: PAS domain S-box protein [Ignavibacteriales bacterium]